LNSDRGLFNKVDPAKSIICLKLSANDYSMRIKLWSGQAKGNGYYV